MCRHCPPRKAPSLLLVWAWIGLGCIGFWVLALLAAAAIAEALRGVPWLT